MLTQEAGRQPDCEAEWLAAKEIVYSLGGIAPSLRACWRLLVTATGELAEYLNLLQHNLKQALPARFASWTRHEADLYSTLKISEIVIAEEPRLQDILDVLTWSGSAPMGRDLLAMLIDTKTHIELTNALGLGTALRILQHVPETNSYAIHRLVREVQREQNLLTNRHTWSVDLCQRIGDWFATQREDFMQLSRFEPK